MNICSKNIKRNGGIDMSANCKITVANLSGNPRFGFGETNIVFYLINKRGIFDLDSIGFLHRFFPGKFKILSSEDTIKITAKIASTDQFQSEGLTKFKVNLTSKTIKVCISDDYQSSGFGLIVKYEDSFFSIYFEFVARKNRNIEVYKMISAANSEKQCMFFVDEEKELIPINKGHFSIIENSF